MSSKSLKSSIWTFSLIILAPLWAQAKEAPPANRISVEKARESATRIYPGKVLGEELEFEGGRWIYSFDLKKPKDKQVHEIHIDALSGKLLDAHTETAADERKEASEDAATSTHSSKPGNAQ